MKKIKLIVKTRIWNKTKHSNYNLIVSIAFNKITESIYKLQILIY